MKRSEINRAIKWAEALCKKYFISLPSFSSLNPDKKEFSLAQRKNIVKTMLGWDVTDFGTNDFEHCGAVLFTVRNGDVYNDDIGTPYAEKYIFLKDGIEQEIPLHYHIHKTEDIINRVGGTLCVQLFAKGEDGKPDSNAPVAVYMDGVRCEFPGGTVLEIENGNSITLTPYLHH